ncbi:TPA: hypothetical protein NHO12_004448 [Pseudomonas aeruginosa]|jgi:hypothetical protein|uniref:Uncharacterized protein n=1 Tax=Ectopseudomonas oleovorans TaxID=301 RepID=A0A379JZL3_ECTOL|nr:MULTISPECIES: hypothetical protein [Pseudomonadaceae]MBA1264912.1 hypothetical protein [Stutzerimonas stutzeri]MCO3921560.1 hypothetical protein [Pseudomonas aeruginosa]TXR38122.1 hypothetical protein FVE88_15970 [Pseudomonas mendocina]SUD57876.1 Uncharacterised protein [Pseudomonas oleovorans]HCE6273547.1 hypothetical protein [Pseudomonas aeruginosa]
MSNDPGRHSSGHLNREIKDLEQRALNSSAKASSLIRKLLSGSPHASLDSVEIQVAELQAVRNELADRTGRSALE